MAQFSAPRIFSQAPAGDAWEYIAGTALRLGAEVENAPGGIAGTSFTLRFEFGSGVVIENQAGGLSVQSIALDGTTREFPATLMDQAQFPGHIYFDIPSDLLAENPPIPAPGAAVPCALMAVSHRGNFGNSVSRAVAVFRRGVIPDVVVRPS